MRNLLVWVRWRLLRLLAGHNTVVLNLTASPQGLVSRGRWVVWDNVTVRDFPVGWRHEECS